MRKYGWVIVFGTLMAVALVVFLCIYHTPIVHQLTFSEQVQGMEIKPFYDETDDIYYLFIPAYTDKGHISIEMPDDAHIRFSSNGNDLGNSLAQVPLNEPVELSITSSTPPYRELEKHTIELLQSENLTTLFIETGEGGMESVHLNKENELKAAIVSINEEGITKYRGMCTLSGRGNTTWGQAKKPYNLKLNQEVNLIENSDSASKWCLLANYGDDSQIRNALCGYIARGIGIPYTSKIDFISLYINGEYQGLYNLATKQNYLKDKNLKSSEVFEKNQENRIHDGVSNYGFYFRTRYGDTKNVLNAINSFETELYSKSSSYQSLEQYADINSIARKNIVDFVCANLDVFLSQYYIVDKTGKISAICAWDYDLSYGLTSNYPDFNYNELALGQPWYNSLFERVEYRHDLLNLLQQYQNLLRIESVVYEDSICKIISSDWNSNYVRWKNFEPAYSGNRKLKADGYAFNTLQGQKAYIDDFREKRLAFLKDYWTNPNTFNYLRFTDLNGAHINAYCRHGETFSNSLISDGLFSMPDEGFAGWYTKDGTSITDIKEITHDMSFDERIITSRANITKIMEKVSNKSCLLILVFVFGCLVLWLIIKTVIVLLNERKR